MLKRVIIVIMLGLIFSSCDFIYYGKIAIQDNIARIERERERGIKKKRWTISKWEYKISWV